MASSLVSNGFTTLSIRFERSYAALFLKEPQERRNAEKEGRKMPFSRRVQPGTGLHARVAVSLPYPRRGMRLLLFCGYAGNCVISSANFAFPRLFRISARVFA